eukprot:GILJ01004400.1.p1 GENE.GILJ01004400.1~~GILJ01004400.1.p1  ORF type:complete len:733 (-),score=122.41 GILJ01004400.1:182-2380(-)
MGNTSSRDPVESVVGAEDLPPSNRGRTLGAFLDVPNQSIIIVSKNALESFHPTTGDRKLKVLLPHPACCVEFNKTSVLGSVLLVGCEDRMMRVFDSLHFSVIAELGPQQPLGVRQSGAAITSILCPLNNTVLLGYSDGSTKAWFLETGQEACTYAAQDNATGVSCLAFSAKRQWILTGHDKGGNKFGRYFTIPIVPVRIYNLRTGSYVKELQADEGDILSLAVINKWDVAVGLSSFKNSCHIWDLEQGTELMVFQAVLPGYGPHNALTFQLEQVFDILFIGYSDGSFLSSKLERVLRPADNENGEEAVDLSWEPLKFYKPKEVQPGARSSMSGYGPAEGGNLLTVAAENSAAFVSCLWYDSYTDSLVIGDGSCHCRIVYELLGTRVEKVQFQPPQPKSTSGLALFSLSTDPKEQIKSRKDKHAKPPTVAGPLPLFSLKQTATDVMRRGGLVSPLPKATGSTAVSRKSTGAIIPPLVPEVPPHAVAAVYQQYETVNGDETASSRSDLERMALSRHIDIDAVKTLLAKVEETVSNAESRLESTPEPVGNSSTVPSSVAAPHGPSDSSRPPTQTAPPPRELRRLVRKSELKTEPVHADAPNVAPENKAATDLTRESILQRSIEQAAFEPPVEPSVERPVESTAVLEPSDSTDNHPQLVEPVAEPTTDSTGDMLSSVGGSDVVESVPDRPASAEDESSAPAEVEAGSEDVSSSLAETGNKQRGKKKKKTKAKKDGK